MSYLFRAIQTVKYNISAIEVPKVCMIFVMFSTHLSNISAYSLKLYCNHREYFYESVSQAGTSESLRKDSILFIALFINN